MLSQLHLPMHAMISLLVFLSSGLILIGCVQVPGAMQQAPTPDVTLTILDTPGSSVSSPTLEPRWLTPVGTVMPLTPYPRKPGETGVPTPFPTRVVVIPSAVPGADNTAFAATPAAGYTPPPAPRPEDPYLLMGMGSRGGASVVDLATVEARAIVIGRVEKVGDARWTTPDGKRPANPHAPESKETIFRPVLLEVESHFKGDEKPAQIMLMAYGGQIGQDRVEWASDDTYEFDEGQRVLVFIKPYVARVVVDNLPLWSLVERYTITDDGTATNEYDTRPLADVLGEIAGIMLPEEAVAP